MNLKAPGRESVRIVITHVYVRLKSA